MDIMLATKGLREERMGLFNDLHAELDATAGRARNGEEQAKIDRIDTRITEIDTEVTYLDGLHRREQEAGAAREADARVYGNDGDRKVADREQSENDQLRAWLRGGVEYRRDNPFEINIAGARKEREMLRQGASAEEVRAIAWDTGSVASGVPTTMARSLYETLEAFTVMFRMPTYKFNTSSGEQMKFPKVNAHAIATQVSGQGTLLAGTDPTFLSMTLDAFKYGELCIVSNEALTDTAFPLADFVARDIGRAIGRVVDRDLTVGTGSGQPMGVMTAITGSGTIATGGSLITPTYEKLIDLIYSVADAYRASPSVAFLFRDSSAAQFRKLRDGNGGTIGSPMWQESLTNGITYGQPDRFLGFPVYTGANVASMASNNKIVAFGDFSAYFIRHVGNIVLDSDSSRYFDTDQTGFRGRWRIDGDLIDATAINALVQTV